MTDDSRSPASGTRRRLLRPLLLGLGVIVLAAFVVFGVGRSAEAPAVVAPPAADCEETPPASEFAVAECDAAEGDAVAPAGTSPER